MQQEFAPLYSSLSNEDTSLELQLLPKNLDHIYCLAGSGSRVLPLLARGPRQLSIVDYSFEQLALTTLRIETLKLLDHKDFLAFWGYVGAESMQLNQRIDLLEDLKLSPGQKEFILEILQENNHPVYAGQFEKMLLAFSKLVRTTLGSHINSLRQITDHQDFVQYLYQDFPWKRWKFLIRMLDQMAKAQSVLNKKSNFRPNFEQTFNALFRNHTPRESFLMQLVFFGELIDAKGAPVEADASAYQQMKQGLAQCQINYYLGDFFSVLNSLDDKVDFVSLGDILSYFPQELSEVYLQKIKSRLNPGALVVHRYYSQVKQNLDSSGFEKITDQCEHLIEAERTQIHRVDIFRLNSM